MPTIARFSLTPVKSTALVHPNEIVLGLKGVAEDRRFLFVDDDGRRISDAAKADLLAIRSTFDAKTDRLTLELPGGTQVEGDAAPIGDLASVALFDREVDVRMVGGPFSDAVSQHLGRELALVRVEPPERGGGAHPVSIVSSASVEELGRRAGREAPDPRRFRMLVEVDGCAPHEEDEWSGRLVRLGGSVVRVGDGVPRCVVTTMDPESGVTDYPTLDVLAAYRGVGRKLPFGVYGDVVEPGIVRVGDPVDLLDD